MGITPDVSPAQLEQARGGDAETEESTSSQSGAVSFPELVAVHFQFQREQRRIGAGVAKDVEQDYREKLVKFEQQEGKILHAYWSTQRPSAVALTLKTPDGLWPLVKSLFSGRDEVIRLHRATDWLAREARVAELLHHSDTLAIKVSEVLKGPTERIAMQWIYAVQSHLLGFIERSRGKPADRDIKDVVKTQREELIQIEKYYARAGGNAARIAYFWGMMIGIVVTGVVGAAATGALFWGGWFDEPHTRGAQTFVVCYVAGGLGAVISVLMRMSSNRFKLDYEVGRPTIRRLGSFRPFIGAIFGIALYFLFQSDMLEIKLPEESSSVFFFFGILAFLAGFNERWTKVVLGTAQKTVATSLGDSRRKDEDEEDEDEER